MSFDSLEYWLFLILALVGGFVVRKRWTWLPLLALSYFFYGFWRIEFCGLLLISTAVDYWAALKIGSEKTQRRGLWLILSLVVNLGLLSFFKIMLLVEGQSIGDFIHDGGNFLLPIGISFYTFQTIGYTIDVYKRKIEPERHFGYFALYVSFFPQLIAGPIERAGNLLPQLKRERSFSWINLSAGSRLIIYGLFKKLVIADYTHAVCSYVWFEPQGFSGGAIALAMVGEAIWIYAEFSAYTDIAIGSAKLMDIDLISNFRRPYFSKSHAEHWSRWHMSLTNWMRDYLFTPMVRARVFGKISALYILFIYVVIGAWHGFNINYLLFGLFSGTVVVLERMFRLPAQYKTGFFGFLMQLKTFMFWILTGFFFFSDSMDDIIYKWTHIFSDGWSIQHAPGYYRTYVILIAIGALVMFLLDLINPKDLKNPIDNVRNKWVRWGLYYFMIFMIICFTYEGDVVFAYFQF